MHDTYLSYMPTHMTGPLRYKQVKEKMDNLIFTRIERGWTDNCRYHHYVAGDDDLLNRESIPNISETGTVI